MPRDAEEEAEHAELDEEREDQPEDSDAEAGTNAPDADPA